LRDSSRHTWLVLSAALEPRATVVFPFDFDFRVFSNGRAWGFHRDSMDVLYVVAFDVDLAGLRIAGTEVR
jgi:hypothetical protein